MKGVPPWLLILCIVVCLSRHADAQPSTFEGRQIVDIEYSPAGILDPRDLERLQTLKKNSPLRMADVSKAVDRLFSSGRFQDVVVEAEPSGTGVLVRFVTPPAWFIGGVSIAGKTNQPPNRGELASASRLALGAEFQDDDLNRGLDRIRRILRANGLYEAEVTPEIERDPEAQQVFVTFRLHEGKRAKYEMPTIQGDTKLPDSTILRATGWRIPVIHWWRQVTDARTRKGVQGVLGKYQKQNRLTAQVKLRKLDYDEEHRRVRPSLNIDAGPKIRVEAVEAKVSQRVLKRYVPVFQERSVDNDLLVEGARNLRDYFQSKGYYDVDVDFRVRPPENDTETIEYVISQGERFKLAALRFTGNRYFPEDTFRERMFLQPASLTARHGRYSEAFRRKDEQNLTNLYRANGFRDVKVNGIVERDYGGKPGDIGLTMEISEGPQWLVNDVSVNGVSQINKEDLLANLASLSGQPFSEANMAADRSFALTYYYSHGFPSATFKAAWKAREGNRADVIYTISEGARQYVRGVITTGLKTTRQSLVDRRMTMKAGDPLSPVEETEIQKNYYDMGVFARVDTAIENADGDTNYKYILYNFTEANRYTLSLGFGAQVGRFGTPSSESLAYAAGTTGFSPLASINVSRINFLGLGHTASLRGVYSSLQKRASLSYFAPRFRNVDGRNITAALLYDDSYDVRTFASRREEASIQVSQQFTKATSGLFRLAYRRVSVSNVIIPVLLVPQLLQPVRLGIVSANLIQDRRDNPGDPHRGIYNTGEVAIAAKVLGSQRNFSRVLLRNATYYRLTRNVVLARQTQFGIITPFSVPQGLTEETAIPLPEKFFGGGADSLRAFPFNQAGPRDTGAAVVPGGPTSEPTGFPLGGNALLFNNVELRFPFIGQNIQGVAFYDFGNVYSTIGKLSFRFRQRNLQDFDYMVNAVGFGIRYKTPVGPIRLDLAYSINPPSFLGYGGTPQELLQCNPSLPPSQQPGFCTPTRQSISHFQFFFSIGQTF